MQNCPRTAREGATETEKMLQQKDKSQENESRRQSLSTSSYRSKQTTYAMEGSI